MGKCSEFLPWGEGGIERHIESWVGDDVCCWGKGGPNRAFDWS